MCSTSSLDPPTHFYFYFWKHEKIYFSRYFLIQNARRTLLSQLPVILFFSEVFFHVIQWWFVICPTFLPPPPTLLQPPSDIQLTPKCCPLSFCENGWHQNQFKLHDWYTISTGVKFTNGQGFFLNFWCVLSMNIRSFWTPHSTHLPLYHANCLTICMGSAIMYFIRCARADTHNYTLTHALSIGDTKPTNNVRRTHAKKQEKKNRGRRKNSLYPIPRDEHAKKRIKFTVMWCGIASLGHYFYALISISCSAAIRTAKWIQIKASSKL